MFKFKKRALQADLDQVQAVTTMNNYRHSTLIASLVEKQEAQAEFNMEVLKTFKDTETRLKAAETQLRRNR